jgi:hypothetical protein
MDYDSWKLATPWDDEVSVTVSFECNHCEEFNDDVDAIAGRRDDYVYVDCYNCNAENTVDIG